MEDENHEHYELQTEIRFALSSRPQQLADVQLPCDAHCLTSVVLDRGLLAHTTVFDGSTAGGEHGSEDIRYPTRRESVDAVRVGPLCLTDCRVAQFIKYHCGLRIDCIGAEPRLREFLTATGRPACGAGRMSRNR